MKKQIIKNIFSSYFTNSLQMILGIFLVPFLIIKLGKESFGIIALAESAIGILEIIATSVRIALSRHATFSLANGNKDEFISYLSSGKYILICCGLLVLIFGGFISYSFSNIFHVPFGLTLQSKFLFALITTAFFITIPNIVYWSVLYANQRFDLINLASSFGLITRALGIFILFSILPFKYVNLITYGYIYLFTRLAENTLIYLWHKRIMPNIKLSIKYFKFERIKEILSFSGYTTLSSISPMLYDNTANILINLFFGPTANAIYAVSLKIPTTIKNIFMKATWTLTPTVTDLAAKNDKQRMEKLFFSYSKILAIIIIPISLFIIFMSTQIITLWVGKGFSTAGQLLSIQMIPLIIIIPLSIVNSVTNAYAKVKIPSQVAFLVAVINVFLGVLLAKVFALRLYGFAISAALCAFINSGLFLPFYSCMISDLPIKKYLSNALLKPFLLGCLTIIPLYFITNLKSTNFSLGKILIEGVFVVFIYYFFSYLFLINKYEKNIVTNFNNKQFL